MDVLNCAPVTKLLYKLSIRIAWLYTSRAYLKKSLPNHLLFWLHGQNGCEQPSWSPSLLLATLVITLLALAGHNLAKHHDTVAIHEGHT